MAWEHPPFWAFEKREIHLTPHWGTDKMLKTQDLPQLWRPNGSIFMAKTSAFFEDSTFYTDQTIGYEMPPERSIDVDDEFGWHQVDCLIKFPFGLAETKAR